jgi:Fur family peroxide stress response transcriptional regulator
MVVGMAELNNIIADFEACRQRLKEAGLRLTPQRIEICKHILNSKEHPSADKVFQDLKQKFPHISLATIYNTFNLMKQLGYIQEVDTITGKARFETKRNFHLNLICSECDQIDDFITPEVAGYWNQIVQALSIQPIGQSVNVYYYCDKCQKKGQKK